MKTIHVLIAASTLAFTPLVVCAQSSRAGSDRQQQSQSQSGTTTTTNTTTTTTTTDPTGSGVGSTGTGTGTTDVGSTGTGTSDVGSTGTGTGTNDVGSTGTGTGTNDVGSTGTGTGTQSVMMSSPYQPKVSLFAASTSLQTPGKMTVTVTLAADAELDPARSGDFELPLASSSASCTLPASVTVAWNSTDGGAASVSVDCAKSAAGTVTISSGSASTSFTTK